MFSPFTSLTVTDIYNMLPERFGNIGPTPWLSWERPVWREDISISIWIGFALIGPTYTGRWEQQDEWKYVDNNKLNLKLSGDII